MARAPKWQTVDLFYKDSYLPNLTVFAAISGYLEVKNSTLTI